MYTNSQKMGIGFNMGDFIELLRACYHDIPDSTLSFEDVETVVDEGLEDDFNCIFEGRD